LANTVFPIFKNNNFSFCCSQAFQQVCELYLRDRILIVKRTCMNEAEENDLSRGYCALNTALVRRFQNVNVLTIKTFEAAP